MSETRDGEQANRVEAAGGGPRAGGLVVAALAVAVAAGALGFVAGKRAGYSEAEAEAAGAGPAGVVGGGGDPPAAGQGAPGTGGGNRAGVAGAAGALGSPVGAARAPLGESGVKRVIMEVQGLMRGGMMNQSAMVKAFGLLQELGESDIPIALEMVDDVPQGQQSQMMMFGLLGRWAEFDGQAAMEYAQEHAKGPMGMGLLGSVAGNWASQDPDAVLEWYESLEGTELGDQLANRGQFLAHQVFQALASKDPKRAIAKAAAIGDERERSMAMSGIAAGAAFDPARRDDLFAELDRLDDDALRNQGRQTILQNWANWEPEAAAEWVDALEDVGDGHLGELRRSVRNGWIQNDPEGAAEWALATAGDDVDERMNAIRDVVQNWVWRNPNGAAEWLGQQGDGPETDPARTVLAQSIAQQDPESAFVWANTISDPNQREHAVQNVFNTWKTKDFEAAAEFLEASDLPPEKVARMLGVEPDAPPAGAAAESAVPPPGR